MSIKHPSEVVKTGDKIQVEVLQVDIPRKRISLTARSGQKRQAFQPEGINRPTAKAKLQSKQGFYSNPFGGLSKSRSKKEISFVIK